MPKPAPPDGYFLGGYVVTRHPPVVSHFTSLTHDAAEQSECGSFALRTAGLTAVLVQHAFLRGSRKRHRQRYRPVEFAASRLDRHNRTHGDPVAEQSRDQIRRHRLRLYTADKPRVNQSIYQYLLKPEFHYADFATFTETS